MWIIIKIAKQMNVNKKETSIHHLNEEKNQFRAIFR